jgi:Zn-finger protein
MIIGTIFCHHCLSTNNVTILKSKTKGKKIKLCQNCFQKHGNSLINGHNYEIIN